MLDLNHFRRRTWDKAVKAAGLEPLRIHDMRHTAASLAIKAGADVKVIQRMLGHASAAMTLDRYGHLMPGQAEAVADRLDVLMGVTGNGRGRARRRSGDLPLFRRTLCRLSYSTVRRARRCALAQRWRCGPDGT